MLISRLTCIIITKPDIYYCIIVKVIKNTFFVVKKIKLFPYLPTHNCQIGSGLGKQTIFYFWPNLKCFVFIVLSNLSVLALLMRIRF